MDAPLLRQLISGKVQFLQARHAVLAQNLANADTPNFAPNDIAEPNFAALVERASKRRMSVGVNRTDAKHLAGTTFRQENRDAREVDGFEVTIAGNSVVIEEQAQKLQEVRLQYDYVTGIYDKIRGMQRTALGNGTS